MTIPTLLDNPSIGSHIAGGMDVKPEDIQELLEFFSKNTYKAKDTHPKVFKDMPLPRQNLIKFAIIWQIRQWSRSQKLIQTFIIFSGAEYYEKMPRPIFSGL